MKTKSVDRRMINILTDGPRHDPFYRRGIKGATRAELKAAVKIISKRLSAVNRKLANLPTK